MSWTFFFFFETFFFLFFLLLSHFSIYLFFPCAFTNAQRVEEEISAGVFIRGGVD